MNENTPAKWQASYKDLSVINDATAPASTNQSKETNPVPDIATAPSKLPVNGESHDADSDKEEDDGASKKRKKHEGETEEERAERKRRRKEKKEKKEKRKSKDGKKKEESDS